MINIMFHIRVFLFQDKLNTGADTGHKSLYMFLLSFDIGQEISMKTC